MLERKKHGYADRIKYMRLLEGGRSFESIHNEYGINKEQLKVLWKRYEMFGVKGLRKKEKIIIDFALRKRIVLDIEENHLTLHAASLKYGASPQRISVWLKLYRENGWAALESIKRRGGQPGMGRPRKDEATAQNKTEAQIVKDKHDKNYFDMQSNIDSLTQADIDQAADDNMISYSQARNLTKQLQKNRDKQIKQLEKDKTAEEKLLVAKNSLNNQITDPATLTTNEAKEYAQKEMPKVYEKQYVAKLSEIKNTAFEKGDMSEDEQRKAVNDLNALNPLGKHAPEEEVARIARDCRTDLLKNLRTNINAWIPIRGTKANDIELKAREEAYNELAAMANESKRPLTTAEIKDVCDKYRPKLDDYVQNTDVSKLEAMKDNLFAKASKTTKSKGYTTKEETYVLKTDSKFKDLNDYIDLVEKADGLTDSERTKLYKPVFMNMQHVIAQALKENTIESYAMKRLIDIKYGGDTSNPTAIYKDWVKIMQNAALESRRKEKPDWFYGGATTGDIDNVINQEMKDSPMANGNTIRLRNVDTGYSKIKG